MIRHFDSLLGLGLLAGAGVAYAQAVPPPSPPPAAEASPTSPVAETRPGVDFHAALAPFGTWKTLEPFGEVWVPSDLPPDWRPYTTGHWVFADAVGWTWVDDAPWGWAAFHYGRWTLDASLGWVWIPGDVWAPAWVAWRECDGFIGWAPLPPCATWRPGIGLFFGGVNVAVAIGDPWWSFVPIGHLCHPRVIEVLLVPERAKVVLRSSGLVRGVFLENGHPVNRAISVERIEKASGQPVKRVILHDVDGPEGSRETHLSPNEVAIHRPHTQPRESALAARAPESPRAPVQVTLDRLPQMRAPTQPHAMHRAHHRWWPGEHDGQRGRAPSGVIR